MTSPKLSHAQAQALQARLDYLNRVQDFDAARPGSRPTGEQQEALDCICSYKIKNVFVTGGNRSGKSQLLRRLAAWFLAEPEEAQWKRRPEWQGPLTGLLISKSHKQLEGSIIDAIKPFFKGDPKFKIIRNGHYIERLEHKGTGNVIWTFVHENAGQCRERVQSFAAHMVLLDEFPAGPHAAALLEEATARVTDHKGVFAAFFTPKSINPKVKQWVEGMKPPAGKKFSLSFLNNPGIDQEAKDSRVAEIQALPEHMRSTILTGAWLNAEHTVYQLSDEALVPTQNYSPHMWRHVVSVDPGLASAQGVVVSAEDPRSGKWYVVYSEKQEKLSDADEAVEAVWCLIQQHQWNVCQVTYDPAGTYWYRAARKHANMRRYKITAPFNKNSTERKEEMISNLQLALGVKLFVPPWNEDLVDEFNNCEWSDTTEGKIKKGQKFHLLDALRYFVDTMPKYEGKPVENLTFEQTIAAQRRAEHEKFVKKQAASQARQGNWRSGGRITGVFRMGQGRGR